MAKVRPTSVQPMFFVILWKCIAIAFTSNLIMQVFQNCTLSLFLSWIGCIYMKWNAKLEKYKFVPPFSSNLPKIIHSLKNWPHTLCFIFMIECTLIQASISMHFQDFSLAISYLHNFCPPPLKNKNWWQKLHHLICRAVVPWYLV